MRSLKTFIIVAAVALLCASPAAAQFGKLPDVLGKHKDKIDKAQKASDLNKTWTPDDEEKIGEASASKLISIFGLYDNPEMTKYVNLVGNTVAAQASRTDVHYHFAILNTSVINAMAMPGGFIFVTRGALGLMNNESELAGVLAHEVAHLDGRHLEKEVKARGNAGMALAETKEHAQGTLNKAPLGLGEDLWKMAENVVNQALTNPYSRDHESDADKHGLDFAAKAGYFAGGLRDFLQDLSQATGNTQKALGLWGATHPPLPDRVATLNKLLGSYPASGQMLNDRFGQYVNAKAFGGKAAKTSAASSSPAKANSLVGAAPASNSSQEYDGVVRRGVVVLSGSAKLPEGAKVKVRVQ